ncbi:MAG: helix-turn-helix domain-containing protein [Ruminococcaceae bacterium]|nr:helix-turn-helix domain-containing protein [Oscillospiraceae bacterium]
MINLIINGYWGEIEENENFIIDSCGHIFTFQGREINRPNGRPNYLLLYIYHGEAKFYLKGREYICKDGDFVLYSPNEPQHHIYESNISGEFYYVHFSLKNKKILNLLEMESSTVYSSEPSAEIADIFEKILIELQTKEKNYKKLALNLVSELFIKVNRQINRISFELYSKEIYSVIQFINKNFMKNHTLEDYAKKCNLSKYHFLREFKKQAKISPIKYRNTLRIRHAKERLRNTKDSIKTIADDLGFSSTEYFSGNFKNIVGVSPTEFREQNSNIL